MKPRTPQAMHQLIEQIRDNLPLTNPATYTCSDNCNGCSMKLVEYIDTELADWEQRLKQGEVPELYDLKRLANSSKKIYRVLDNNGLV